MPPERDRGGFKRRGAACFRKKYRRALRFFIRMGFAGLVLCLVLPVTEAQTPVAEDDSVTVCATNDFGYTVDLCLIAPAPTTAITTNPVITATVTVENPDIRIRSVVFQLNDRNILSDFDPEYAFELPVTNWVDGTYTLTAKVRLSDDNESTPVSTTLTFDSGTTEPPVAGETFSPTPGRPAAPGEPFVLAAVGDGAGGSPESEAVAAIIGSWNPNLFLYLGDVYNAGTVAEFHNWYAPETGLGRFKSITNPTIGNHEYSGANGPQGYFTYWGTPPHYYSVDTAGWHIISLDSNPKFNETDPASAQMQWLVEDLEASQATCTLVFFHHPPFSVGSYSDSPDSIELRDLWTILVQHQVTLVLTGHDHNYQRWQPLDENGNLNGSGTVLMVIGTGGQSQYKTSNDDARLAAPALVLPGALRLELNPAGAAVQFITTDGEVRDSSVVGCQSPDQAADTSPPTAPGTPLATRSPDGALTLRWAPALDDTGIATYDIYRDGALAGSAPPASAFVDQAITGDPEFRVIARDTAGNVSEPSRRAPPIGAADPAILFADTFSSGSLTRWTMVEGLVIEPANQYDTAWVARARGGLHPAFARTTFAAFPANQTELDFSVTIDFYLLEQGANPVVLFRIRTVDDASLLGVSIGESGAIGLFDDVSGIGTQSSATVTRQGWHRMTAHIAGIPRSPLLTMTLDNRDIPDIAYTLDLQGRQIGGMQLGDSRENRLYDIRYRGISVRWGPPKSISQDDIPLGVSSAGDTRLTIAAGSPPFAASAPGSFRQPSPRYRRQAAPPAASLPP